MSIKESSRVWDTSKQDSTALLLLLAIADSANDWGYCWPGRKHLARYARCDIATVSRLIAKLEKDNELSTRREPGRSSQYVVLCGLPEEEKLARRERLAAINQGSDKLQLPRNKGSDHHVTTGSDLATGKTVLDPSFDPSNKNRATRPDTFQY